MRGFHERHQMNFTLNVVSVLYYLIFSPKITSINRQGAYWKILNYLLSVALKFESFVILYKDILQFSSMIEFRYLALNDPLSLHVVFLVEVYIWYVCHDPYSRLIRVDELCKYDRDVVITETVFFWVLGIILRSSSFGFIWRTSILIESLFFHVSSNVLDMLLNRRSYIDFQSHPWFDV